MIVIGKDGYDAKTQRFFFNREIRGIREKAVLSFVRVVREGMSFEIVSRIYG